MSPDATTPMPTAKSGPTVRVDAISAVRVTVIIPDEATTAFFTTDSITRTNSPAIHSAAETLNTESTAIVTSSRPLIRSYARTTNEKKPRSRSTGGESVVKTQISTVASTVDPDAKVFSSRSTESHDFPSLPSSPRKTTPITPALDWPPSLQWDLWTKWTMCVQSKNRSGHQRLRFKICSARNHSGVDCQHSLYSVDQGRQRELSELLT